MKTIVFVETNFSGLDALVYCQKRGYRAILITDSPERFESWFPASALYKLDAASEIIKVENSNDFDEVKRVIEDRLGKIDAILTFAEIRTHVVARLAAALGLKGTPVPAVALAQDKNGFRKHLMATGVDSVFSEVVDSIEDLERIQDRIPFPCFIKPNHGHSSIGAVVCRTRSDVSGVVAKLKAIDSEGISSSFVVEDFLDGALVSVEVLTVGKGLHQVLGVSDRTIVAGSVEVGAAFPAKMADLDAVVHKAVSALDAIGYDFGPSHIEIIVTETGPHLVELNTRVGGSGHSVMLDNALARSVTGDCVELCLGTHDLRTDLYLAEQGVAWHCYASETPGVISKMPDIEMIRSMPGVIAAWYHHDLGDTMGALDSNFTWIVQVMCVGQDAVEAKRRAMDAIDLVARHVVISRKAS